MIRPLLAWTAASLASAVLGASLFVALVMANGLADLGFLAPIWGGLIVAGLAIALVVGGAAALILTPLARRLNLPRPLADMAAGACGAFAILLGVQAFIFARMEEPWAPPEFGLVLLIPLAAGAAAGFVFWRLGRRG
jgi:hypothetical protein